MRYEMKDNQLINHCSYCKIDYGIYQKIFITDHTGEKTECEGIITNKDKNCRVCGRQILEQVGD